MRSVILSLAVLALAVSPLAAQVDARQSVPAHTPTVDDLVGTWQLAKMETMRRSEPVDAIAEGAQGTVTFGSDGSMAIALRESGTTDTVRGTYALEESSLTMTIENQSARGSIERDGNSLILHFIAVNDEPAKLEWILTRQ